MVSTSEKAVPFLVMLTLLQVVLSGGLVEPGTGPSQFAYFAPSRWGMGAVAATANLNSLDGFPPHSPARIEPFDPVWISSPGNWLRNMGLMILLGVVFALIAWYRLHALSPRRRKG